jgi:hypothetical protein
MLAALAVLTVTFWVQPAKTAGDEQLAAWALADWARASGGKLAWKRVDKPEGARIRIRWVDADQGLYGEARGGDVYISLGMAPGGDPLLRDTVVYLTCVHESGHALGLRHTAEFADIMYNFQHGGDLREYFARYRRRLKKREEIEANSVLSLGDRAALATVLPAFAP